MFSRNLLSRRSPGERLGCSGARSRFPMRGSSRQLHVRPRNPGWVLNTREGSGFTNLGAGVPDGGSLPTVTFAESDGDPSPGSLRLTVAFTGPCSMRRQGGVRSGTGLSARPFTRGPPGVGPAVACGWECSPADLPTPGGCRRTFCNTDLGSRTTRPIWRRCLAPLTFDVVPRTSVSRPDFHARECGRARDRGGLHRDAAGRGAADGGAPRAPAT